MTLARFACDSCGRVFVTEQPVTIVSALKGSCDCGGRFAAVGSVMTAADRDGEQEPSASR